MSVCGAVGGGLHVHALEYFSRRNSMVFTELAKGLAWVLSTVLRFNDTESYGEKKKTEGTRERAASVDWKKRFGVRLGLRGLGKAVVCEGSCGKGKRFRKYFYRL